MDNFREESPSTELHRHIGEELELENATLWVKLQDLNYTTFLLIGIALLWPWNSFLSASLYFQHDVFHDKTVFAKIYISTMMSISTISSVIFNYWLSKRQHSYPSRIVRGLIWEIMVFGLLSMFVFVHKSLPDWLNFTFLMSTVLVSSLGTAMTQNGAMALANVFGPQFSQGVMVGQAVAGVLPSLVLFLVSYIGDPRDQSVGGIFAYFGSTVLVSVACIVLYRVSSIGSADKHDFLNRELDPEATVSVPFSLLFDKLRYLVLSIFTTFVVTLLFPVFAANTFVSGLPMRNAQYIPLIFTVWNLGDLYGRAISGYSFFQSPSFTPFKTFLYSIARIGLVPLFFCFNLNSSARPSSSISAIVSDLLYILLQFAFGVTNGNVLSVSFMKVSSQLNSDKQRKAAGGFTNIFLSAGLAFGSLLSYLFTYIVLSKS